ncbi:MAG TPA: HD domain-containing protein [Gemmatimonadales bacterium]|nr:HD domain-containing protein [Gemmatimonadales bacterium]
MAATGGFEVVRDPIWNNIGLDPAALAVLDSAPVQRLRYVRQLGHAYLVYPGATHTRFEHALGAYHLARRALGLLAERDALREVPPEDVTLARLAALLHDVGHYPFSHALEEGGLPSHEDLARIHLAHPELVTALEATGVPDAARRIGDLIGGRSTSPLQGLVAGPIDLDKIEYLTRDARMCGVPYGTVDVDRLLHSLTLVPSPRGPTVGLHEKGVSPLESLLFAKYQMYRNVYWHHAVRSATAMFKRAVRTALREGSVTADIIAHDTDEAFMERLRSTAGAPLAERLRRRRLYKRVLDVPAVELPADAGAWVADDPDLAHQVEDRLAAAWKRAPGEVLIDYPVKPEMLSGEVPVVTRHGDVAPARLSIQRMAEDLHRAARRFRIYAADPVPRRQAEAVLPLLEAGPDQIRARLTDSRPLTK